MTKKKTPARKRGRPPTLDAKGKAMVVKILAAGGSRQDAANHVGIHRSNLDRTVLRDKAFADRAREAEMGAKIMLIGSVKSAAKGDWRAAAWMLERKWHEDWAKREPGAVTPEQMAGGFSRFVSAVQAVVPKKYHVKVAACLQDRLKELADA